VREIRRSSDAPIIMLTVRNAERDKVLALDAGADDYVVKPFESRNCWPASVLPCGVMRQAMRCRLRFQGADSGF